MYLTLTNSDLDKYLGFLSRLDNVSKKKLIKKLTESIEAPNNSTLDLRSLFGAWEDYRDSDDIIKEIIDSRVNNRNIADM